MTRKRKRKLYYCSHSRQCNYYDSCHHYEFHRKTERCIVDYCDEVDEFVMCISVFFPSENVEDDAKLKHENGYSLLEKKP